MTKTERFLTTKDNPFDPFDSFDDWFAFDCEKQYFTCSYLDRVLQNNLGKQMSNNATDEQVKDAMLEIVNYNPELYRVVSREVEEDEFDID